MRYISVLVVTLLTACQTVGASQPNWTHPPPPVEELGVFNGMLVSFIKSAFFVDGEKNFGEEVRLRRRIAPLNVSFRGNDHGIRPLVEAKVREMSAITGVPYRFVAPSGRWRRGDVVFQLRSRSEIKYEFQRGMGYAPSGECIAIWYSTETGWRAKVIDKSQVWIDREARNIWKRCVIEELAHGLGLTGDGKLALPSAFGFAPSGELDEMTPTDKAALWVVYHPDLRPGMTWAEAEPIVRRIVNETWGYWKHPPPPVAKLGVEEARFVKFFRRLFFADGVSYSR